MSAVRIIVTLFSLMTIVSADDGPPARSHREKLFGLSDSIVHRFINDQWKETAAPVSLHFSPDTFTRALRPLLIQSFVGREMNVSESNEESRTSIEILVTESSVEFSDVFTESFFGSQKTVRTVRLSVSMIVRDSGNILRAVPLAVGMTDTVRYSDIERLTDNTFPLTSVRTPSLTWWDSLLEPAIITMASAVAIYLFFTIRS